MVLPSSGVGRSIIGGGGGNIHIFVFCTIKIIIDLPTPLLPRLDFLQFQHDFRSFSDKRDITRGAKTLQWGGGAT